MSEREKLNKTCDDNKNIAKTDSLLKNLSEISFSWGITLVAVEKFHSFFHCTSIPPFWGKEEREREEGGEGWGWGQTQLGITVLFASLQRSASESDLKGAPFKHLKSQSLHWNSSTPMVPHSLPLSPQNPGIHYSKAVWGLSEIIGSVKSPAFQGLVAVTRANTITRYKSRWAFYAKREWVSEWVCEWVGEWGGRHTKHTTTGAVSHSSVGDDGVFCFSVFLRWFVFCLLSLLHCFD